MRPLHEVAPVLRQDVLAVAVCIPSLEAHTLPLMNPMDRRRFLLTSAAAAASVKAFAQTPAQPHFVIPTLHFDKPGPTVPHNFIGLSYESQQLSDPSFFSLANTSLIARFDQLSPQGVLRIGGNTSDVGWWKPSPEAKQPPLPANVVLVPSRPGERPFQELAYAITPEAIHNLRAFLDATGWTCLYGLNLGSSTPARAAEEAAFVAATLGSRLEYFQLGNEPDLFPARFRDKATWTVDRYLDEWLASANAVRERVPSARFGLPDTSGNPAWSSRVAERLYALRSQNACPTIGAITHHYYFGGPPSNPKVNIDRLLHPDPRVASVAATTRAAAQQLGVLYRMTEGNTCYKGGKPGVSDVFASTLWAADYLLTLASYGYAGANLHGGGGKAVADSLGGTLPGELLMADPKAPHPRPFYTPIAERNGESVAEPIFFGMKFAGAFAGATLIPVDFDPGPVNAVAFAGRHPGHDLFALINKDQTVPLFLDLNGDQARPANQLATEPGWEPVQRLVATSLTSTEVTLSPPAMATPDSQRPGPIAVPAGYAALFQRARR
jgi:hypothetical protein